MTNFATGSIYDELLCKIDDSIESRIFHKIVILVSLGMLEASIGVYTGSAVAGNLTASKWSTSQETSMFLSANFSGTTTIEDKQNEGGRQVTLESYAEHT